MQDTTSRLYAVRECSDVFVDAALCDEAGELQFLSIYGRDTALLHFLAAFSLPVTQGGFDAFTLTDGTETHRVNVSNPNDLEKLTGRFPRGNLFGNLTHAWLYRGDLVKPDRTNRRMLVLRFGETDEVFARRLWLLIRELCPVPLPDHWREPLLALLGDELIAPLSAGSAPAIGVVDGAHLALPADFERIISAAVALQILTLKPGTAVSDGDERLRNAVRLVRATAAPAPGDNEGTAPLPSVPPLFEPGRVVCTHGVSELIEAGRVSPMALLACHLHGDWGASSEPELNDAAVKDGGRIFSAYPIDHDQPCKGYGDNTIWVITEWDRSVTTLMLPSEY